MKAIRFKFINLAAHILQRGHDLVIKFSSQKLVDHPSGQGKDETPASASVLTAQA